MTSLPGTPTFSARPLETRGSSVDLRRLLTLEANGSGDDSRSASCNDLNSNGRVFGGQLLGQAVAAATRSMDPTRRVATLQLAFLRSARVEVAIDFGVERLQDGRRYASRRIAGRQADDLVFSAHVTSVAAQHVERTHAALPRELPRPGELRTFQDLPAWLTERLAVTNFRLRGRDSIDFRLVDPEGELVPLQSGPSCLRYWIRAAQPLGQDPALHAAGLAYLSDFWLTFPALAHRVTKLPQHPVYVASVNHAMWFLAPCRADEWLYVQADGIDLEDGRAMSHARIWNLDGCEVARMTQECAVSDRV